MKSTINIIEEAILNVCISPVVENGIFDPYNNEHIFCLIENLEKKNLSEDVIAEAVAAIRYEGKYPERQAYNKEGWLVTFPSQEYKNAAIKRGTHFASDPTHGKGGMHLYYKKKGKQKRMAQQDPTQTEPSQPSQPSAPPQPEQQPAPQKPKQNQPSGNSDLPPSGGADAGEAEDVTDAPIDFKSQYDKDPDALPKSDAAPEEAPAGGQNKSAGGEQPAPPPAPAAPPPPSFVNVSVEFAKSKQWNPTPFGEWRNATGETTAVVSLSGEVVPIKNTDREELKLFAAKKQP